MTRARRDTPVRGALRADSPLRPRVEDGLGAVQKKDRRLLHEDVVSAFDDSLDVDEGLRERHPGAHRWDYLLGLAGDGALVALEVHSARDDEVKTIIAKRRAALDQLRPHLKDGERPERWIWLAPGRARLPDTDKTRRLLDQNGITFAGSRLLPKHLPSSGVPTPRRRPKGRS